MLINRKINLLVDSIPDLIKNFDYRKGPDLYFYKKTMELRRTKRLSELFADPERYIELIYATLVSWDMNSRAAEMMYFDGFKTSILENKQRFLQLETHKLEKLSGGAFGEAKMLLGEIYDNMHLMLSKAKLVSNSKVMHFILPDLVMPMDRQNTLNFFFGNTTESKDKFLTIFSCSREIAQKRDLHQFLDNGWHQSVPKIIDNAIISHETPKYNKKSK
jgi:hypothetical protein